MIDGRARRAGRPAAAHLVHREFLQLGLLVLVAIGAFAATRAVAANNRAMSRRDAAEWYARGERALANGSIGDAITALRRATTKDRHNRTYVLALARLLARDGREASARAALLELRDAEPDDAEVNLQLARLAAKRYDVTEASRYYHNALYAPWTGDHADARRAIRLELIQFLLAHNQKRRALAELLAFSADLPDTPDAHLRVARFFSAAGDPRRALAHYADALRLAPDNQDARAGAGLAAYKLGDYATAYRYFHDLHSNDPAVTAARTVARLVLSADPLAPRIGRAERRRRLLAAFAYAKARLATCVGGPTENSADSAPQGSLAAEIAGFEPQLTPPDSIDADTVDAGLDLTYRIEQTVSTRCDRLLPMDEALLAIGHAHGAGEP